MIFHFPAATLKLTAFCLCQVKKLQTDIGPLHHSMSIMSEKNGTLQADKRLMEEDLKHWKAKAQVPAQC